MQEVTTESVLGTIIGHLNVEKARLIADREHLARRVQELTAELAAAKLVAAEKPAELPVAVE